MSDLAAPVDSSDHKLGRDDAPITLLEFGDYECPDCGHAYPIINQLREALGDRLRYVYRHFPLSNVHPRASVAAQAAEAAHAQGKFWPMHNQLFEHQQELAQTDLTKYALRVGLEIYGFESDLAAERYAGKVHRDYENGVLSGVKSTPGLFINEKRYTGTVEYEPLLAALNAAAG